jgi:hypothetical protein
MTTVPSAPALTCVFKPAFNKHLGQSMADCTPAHAVPHSGHWLVERFVVMLRVLTPFHYLLKQRRQKVTAKNENFFTG